MSLPTRTLGKTGLDVSVLGFGAAPVSFLKTEAEQAAAVIHKLLDEGVSLIDTATMYHGSHDFLGEHVTSKRRDDFTLVDKVGSPGGKQDKWTPEVLKGQVDDSLSKMKVDHVDVMLLHSCSLEILEADEALGALVDCRDAGKVKHIGYSGDGEAASFACRLPDIAVLECSVNLCDQANIDDALNRAHRHDVGVIAKRPIANAAWKDLSDQKGFYKTYAKTYTQRLAAMKEQADGLEPAEFGCDSWAELAMRFTLAQPISTAIVGTTDPDNAEANLRIAQKGPLDDTHAERLRAAFGKAAEAAGEDWPAQT